MRDRDKEISEIVEGTVKRVLETEPAAVFSRSEVMDRVRQQVTRWSPTRNDRLLDDYQSGEIGRRKFLKLLGFGVGGAAVASSGGFLIGKQIFDEHGDTLTGYQVATGEVPSRFNFSSTVNIVEDVGADNTGNQPIDDALDQAISSNTLIEFPEGTYTLQSDHVIGQNNVGMIGAEGTEFQMPKGMHGQGKNPPGKNLINATGNNFLFKDIDWNQRGDWQNPDEKRGIPGMRFAGQGWHVENVEYKGRGMVQNHSTPIAFLIGPNGENNLLKNGVSVQGSDWSRYWNGNMTMDRFGVYIGAGPTSASVRLESLHLEEFGNNSIYGGRTGAAVHVAGGIYRNNNVGGPRVAGGNSRVDGAYIAVDPDKYSGPTTWPTEEKDKGWRMRGIWVEDRRNRSPQGQTEIHNCDFLIKDHKKAGPAIEIPQNWQVKVTESRFRYEKNGLAVIRSGNDRENVIENSHFTGDSSGSTVIDVNGSVRDVHICMPNRNNHVTGGASTSNIQTRDCDEVRDAPAGPSGTGFDDGSDGSSSDC